MFLQKNKIKFINLFIDLSILNLTILFLSALSQNIDFDIPQNLSTYLLMGNISLFFSFFVFSKTRFFNQYNYIKQIKGITTSTLIFIASLTFVHFLGNPHQHSLTFLLECFSIFYLGQISFYHGLHLIFKFKRKKGYNTNRVLIVDKNEHSSILANVIRNNPSLGYSFVGYAANKTDNQDVLGTPDQLSQLIRRYHINTVIDAYSLSPAGNMSKEYRYLCRDLGVRILFIPENKNLIPLDANQIYIGELVLVNPQKLPLDNLGGRIMKRLFDLLFSSFVIVFVFSWLFPIIALLIKVNSKGPIFFIQQRTGRNNATFRIIKFRSMRLNDMANHYQATSHDERITLFGKILRDTFLDELPQFFNVFLGQMSVVGPRPHMLRHTCHFSKLIRYYKFRHIVKPGITGWAQLNGYRGGTEEIEKMEKRIEYDREYIENWNFWKDIQIVWNSVFNLNGYKRKLANGSTMLNHEPVLDTLSRIPN